MLTHSVISGFIFIRIWTLVFATFGKEHVHIRIHLPENHHGNDYGHSSDGGGMDLMDNYGNEVHSHDFGDDVSSGLNDSPDFGDGHDGFGGYEGRNQGSAGSHNSGSNGFVGSHSSNVNGGYGSSHGMSSHGSDHLNGVNSNYGSSSFQGSHEKGGYSGSLKEGIINFDIPYNHGSSNFDNNISPAFSNGGGTGDYSSGGHGSGISSSNSGSPPHNYSPNNDHSSSYSSRNSYSAPGVHSSSFSGSDTYSAPINHGPPFDSSNSYLPPGDSKNYDSYSGGHINQENPNYGYGNFFSHSNPWNSHKPSSFMEESSGSMSGYQYKKK